MRTDFSLKLSMQQFFDEKAEIEVRSEKSFFGDKINKAVFSKTIKEEFEPDEIRRAVKCGILGEKKIREPGTKTQRTVYLWLGKDERQVTKLKGWIQKWFG